MTGFANNISANHVQHSAILPGAGIDASGGGFSILDMWVMTCSMILLLWRLRQGLAHLLRRG